MTFMATRKDKMTKKEAFFADFAPEIDIFDSDFAVPEWVFSYRDALLRKISRETMLICRELKQLGLDFKIKWPVEIDGKWKFADIFFPGKGTVLIVSDPLLNPRPMGLPSYRAEFFRCRYRVVEVDSLDGLRRKMELKASQAVTASIP